MNSGTGNAWPGMLSRTTVRCRDALYEGDFATERAYTEADRASANLHLLRRDYSHRRATDSALSGLGDDAPSEAVIAIERRF